ncbi:unnamed protein product, partial [Oikopleura dioica]
IIQSVELVIKVVDHDQVGSNDPIGKVVLRKRDARTEQKQSRTVFMRPRK